MTEISPRYLNLNEYFVVETLVATLFSEETLKINELKTVVDFVTKYKDSAEFTVEFDMCEEEYTTDIVIKACKLHTTETLKKYVETQEQISKEQKSCLKEHELKQLKRLIGIYGVPAELLS